MVDRSDVILQVVARSGQGAACGLHDQRPIVVRRQLDLRIGLQLGKHGSGCGARQSLANLVDSSRALLERIVVLQDCAKCRTNCARWRRNKKRCQRAMLDAQLRGNRQGFSILRC